MATSVASPLRRAVATYLLPSLGGAALAALCILSFVALNQTTSGNADSLAVLANRNSQHQNRHMRVTKMVQSATSHTMDAIMEEKRAAALRSEASSASTKVAGLKHQLHHLILEEGEKSHLAAHDAARAKAFAAHAQVAATATSSIKEARDAALASARSKREAFLEDENLAGQKKAEALALLDKERELYHASEKKINQEVSIQAKARSEQEQLEELRKQKRRAADHVAVLTMRSQHATASSSHHYAAAPSPSGASIDRTGLASKDNIKRPLWGAHKWPSYYKNVLTDKKLFSADAPSHPSAMLDRGDDDAAMERGHVDHAQRCDMNNPCGGSVGINGAHFATPARTQTMWQQRRQQNAESTHLQTAEAKSILSRFEDDVQRMETPLVTMEQQLGATLSRDEAMQAHEAAVRQYATEKSKWGELKQSKLQQREAQAAALEAEKMRMEQEMGAEMRQVTHRLQSEAASKVSVLEGALKTMESEMRANKADHSYHAEADAVDLAHRSEAEMEAALHKAETEEKGREEAMASEVAALRHRLGATRKEMEEEAYDLAHSEVQARQAEATTMQEEMSKFRNAQASLESAMSAEEKREEEKREGERASRGRHEAEERSQLKAAVGKIEAAAASRVAQYRTSLAKRRAEVRALESKVHRLEADRRISKTVKEAEERLKSKMEGRLKQMARADTQNEERMARELREDQHREETLEAERGEKAVKLAEERTQVKAARQEGEEAVKFAKEKQVAHQVAADYRQAKESAIKEKETAERRRAAEERMAREAAEAKAAAKRAVEKEGQTMQEREHRDVKEQLSQYEKKLAAQEKAAVATAESKMRRREAAMAAQVREAKEEAAAARKAQTEHAAKAENEAGSLSASASKDAQTVVSHPQPKKEEEAGPSKAEARRFESPIALARQEHAEEERRERMEDAEAMKEEERKEQKEEQRSEAAKRREAHEKRAAEARRRTEEAHKSRAESAVRSKAAKGVKATPGGEVERAFEAIFGGGDNEVIASKPKAKAATAHAQEAKMSEEEARLEDAARKQAAAKAKATAGDSGESSAVGRAVKIAKEDSDSPAESGSGEDARLRARARALGFSSVRAWEKHLHVRPNLDDVRIKLKPSKPTVRDDPVPAEYANAVRAEQLAAQPAGKPVKAFFNSGLSQDRAVPVGEASSSGGSWW